MVQTLGCSPRMRVQPGTEAKSGGGGQPWRAREESCHAEPDAEGKRPFERLLPSLTALSPAAPAAEGRQRPLVAHPGSRPRGRWGCTGRASSGARRCEQTASVPRQCSWPEVSGHSPAAGPQDTTPWFCGGHPTLAAYGMTSGFLEG